MTPSVERIRVLETAAADALPCRVRVDDDGWRLRFNDGVTRRCNAVFPERAGRDALSAKIERAEAFYAARDGVPRFQLTEGARPRGLHRALGVRGYRDRPGALVQTVRLSVLAANGAPCRARGGVRRAPTPERTWLEALLQGSGEPRDALALRATNLAAVAEPKTFIEVVEEGDVVAVGFAVASGPWVGVFNMATVPAWRRRGAATLVLRAAADWGLARGCRDAYLQVHPDNAVARGLYASLGFATHHVYSYWEAPS